MVKNSLLCFVFLSLSFFAHANKHWPFVPAVRVGNTLYLSGHMGFDYNTGILVKGGIKSETKKTLLNIQQTLKANDYTLSNLVKCTVLLANMNDWEAMNEVYRGFFPNHQFPARSAFGVNGLALGGLVEIECIAAKANESTRSMHE